MKKFGKFIFGTISVAALAGGVIYFFKNVLNKDSSDDFDDFEDDFEDFDMDDETEDITKSDETDTRGYVKLNLDDVESGEEFVDDEGSNVPTSSMTETTTDETISTEEFTSNDSFTTEDTTDSTLQKEE